jgi:RNA polymerase sigma factor (TIGR02999 family)
MAETPTEVTQLLVAWGSGDQAALDQLMPLVYDELKRLARRHLGRERRGHTLQTTALVNEAYLKLVDQRAVHWESRAQFFALAAQAMRRILVDHARARQNQKHGGGVLQVEMDEALTISHERTADVIALDDALQNLAQFDARKCRIVELRFFGGLSIEETAQVLQVSPGTVMRDWTLAKAWLQRELGKE